MIWGRGRAGAKTRTSDREGEKYNVRWKGENERKHNSQSKGKNGNQEREGDIISARLWNSFQGRQRDVVEREGWRTD